MGEAQRPGRDDQPEADQQCEPLLPVGEGDERRNRKPDEDRAGRPGIEAGRAAGIGQEPGGGKKEQAERNLVIIENRFSPPFMTMALALLSRAYRSRKPTRRVKVECHGMFITFMKASSSGEPGCAGTYSASRGLKGEFRPGMPRRPRDTSTTLARRPMQQ